MLSFKLSTKFHDQVIALALASAAPAGVQHHAGLGTSPYNSLHAGCRWTRLPVLFLGGLHSIWPAATIRLCHAPLAPPLADCYHMINRGHERARVFHDENDYHAFVRLRRQATARVPMRVIGYCLMPNHFHGVLWPRGDEVMARWMEWLLTTQASHYRQRYGGGWGTSGRVVPRLSQSSRTSTC
jgi:REP element-mobilizing transposase RayT